jgi:hypothetical protein
MSGEERWIDMDGINNNQKGKQDYTEYRPDCNANA